MPDRDGEKYNRRWKVGNHEHHPNHPWKVMSQGAKQDAHTYTPSLPIHTKN